jgi:2',3'-cyclic-nucleotide 2'-phosphodiesterase (5'-nucleotidase family)
LQTAAALVAEMRPHVECLIALTHIGFKKDVELAQRCPEIDLILGGHSHTVLEEPAMVGKTAICQTGSHGRFGGVYGWEAGQLTRYELRPLVPFPQPQPYVRLKAKGVERGDW